MEIFVFYLCGAMMLAGAVMTVASRSAVASAVWLIFTFVSAAGIFATLSAPFLAVLQVLVYAGAIMVLFLFVIMMLQGPVLPGEVRIRSLIGRLALVLPAAAAAVVGFGFFARRGLPPFPGAAPEGFGTAEMVAALLLNRYLLAFELISVVLLVAIVGAVALGRKERSLPWQ